MAKERITRRLKVYTTRIGIHDWAVAVPSQKAALKAWDVRENLFASGAAKVVDDPAVVEAATKTPGVPVALRVSAAKAQSSEKRSNVVSLAERRTARGAETKGPATPEPKALRIVDRRLQSKHGNHKSPPRDRSRVDAAERDLRELEIEIKVRRKELARRKQQLDREIEAFEIDADARRRRLERVVAKAREALERAKVR
ncbi:MAG: hypothetical protein GC190_07480 [Alphaproteobacteria bacterium]|nr:hypothetical protein [Alphaproteobacteria bacterium]